MPFGLSGAQRSRRLDRLTLNGNAVRTERSAAESKADPNSFPSCELSGRPFDFAQGLRPDPSTSLRVGGVSGPEHRPALRLRSGTSAGPFDFAQGERRGPGGQPDPKQGSAPGRLVDL